MSLRITLFASGLSIIPLANFLHSQGKLAGVVFMGDQPQEEAQAKYHLAQAQINTLFFAQETKKGELALAATIDTWQSNLGAVFCCGKKIPMQLTTLFQYKMINIHAGALPEYRGANPIFWHIYNGEKQLTVTVHYLEDPLDTGDIIAQSTFAIKPYDNPNTLFHKTLQQCPVLIDDLENQLQQQGGFSRQPQEGTPTYSAPKVQEHDLVLNWATLSAQALCNQVRACTLQGGARFTMGQEQVQLIEANVSTLPTYNVKAGTIIRVSQENNLIVALSNNQSVELSIVANQYGVFSGYRFAQLAKLSAGTELH